MASANSSSPDRAAYTTNLLSSFQKTNKNDFFAAVIDGTGAYSDESYKIDMDQSFCSQIHRLSGGRSSYLRGPSVDGFTMGEKADWAVQQVRLFGEQKRLFLVGYSRGASACIMAAERLAIQNINVDSMFLFDPVARHVSEGGEVIPANVAFVAVARRMLDRRLVESCAHSIPKEVETTISVTGNVVAAIAIYGYNYINNPMRTWFGFTGTKFLGQKEDMFEQSFRGTHGAIGGVGYKDVKEDKSAQEMVA